MLDKLMKMKEQDGDEGMDVKLDILKQISDLAAKKMGGAYDSWKGPEKNETSMPMGGEDSEGMEVSVAASDKEGLLQGLDQAEDIAEGEMPGEGMDMDSLMDGMDLQDIEDLIAQLEAKKQMLMASGMEEDSMDSDMSMV